MTKYHWKTNYFWPLFDPTVSARLLRVLLPLIILAILIQGFLDETITRLLNINEVLFTALLSLTFAIIVSIVIIQLSRIIFRQAEKAEIERKRTEEKNLQLASIIESSDDAIISKTLEGIITNWNFGAEKIYGYTKEEIINQPISLVIPPDHQDEMMQILEKIRTGHHIDHYETVRQKKDGTQINVSVSISPIYDGEGALIGASTIARDITKHKRAEEELRKLSRAVEQSPASIVVTDTSGAIEYVNAKFIQVTGYMLEEAVGKNPRILKSGEKPAEEYKQLWDILTSGGEWRGEFHNKKKNGELYWESAVISPIKDERGIITHYLGVKEDITERKQAEKKIRESEENFRAIFENNSSAIAIIEPDTTISMVNDAYCQMSGYTKQEVVGMSWTQQIVPDDLERMKEYNRQRLINPQDAPDKYEFKFYKKTGEIRYGLISVSFMQSARKIITSFIDITNRKNAEEEREKLINELKAALADVKTLSGLLPICASCKKIRDDNGYWQQVEGYFQKHSGARFTHGLCPDCTVKYFPEYVTDKEKGLKK